MVEDKKNNDTKEELETSKDDKKMDTQQVNENKDSKNIELDSEKENKLTEDNEKEITETETKEKEIQEGQENEDKVTDIKEEEDDPNAKWYVVGAASGFEERAVKTIQDNARKASLSHFFFDFQIPKQEVVEMRRGKKINSEKNFFPGYMLIKMIMNNQTWQLVKNSNKVSGFTGNDHKPIPLSQSEAIKMLKKADDSIEYIAPKYVYEVGQQVKVIDGPFASFNGMVEEVDEERGRLKISVSIFGRSTPVELEYTQVEKI
jgi:transcriptional antiterminator NusG